MWKWWTAWGTIVVACGLLTGVFPGSTTRVTVDHCSVWHDDQSPSKTRCTGHWSMAGIPATGRVYGVATDGWQAVPLQTPGGWYELKVPDSARLQQVVVVPGAAVAQPTLLWLIRAVAGLIVVVALIASVSRVRDRMLLRAYERKVANRR